MKIVKKDSWSACVELEQKIQLFISMLPNKYNVSIKTDSNYEKGTIKIVIKDKL